MYTPEGMTLTFFTFSSQDLDHMIHNFMVFSRYFTYFEKFNKQHSKRYPNRNFKQFLSEYISIRMSTNTTRHHWNVVLTSSESNIDTCRHANTAEFIKE